MLNITCFYYQWNSVPRIYSRLKTPLSHKSLAQELKFGFEKNKIPFPKCAAGEKMYNHAREAREIFAILPLETAFLVNFRLPKTAPQAKKLRPRFKLSEIAEKN